MLRVERAGVERFHQSREEWNRLVGAMPRPSIFCTWEWIHTWWTHFGAPYDLLLLFIHRGDALVGIFPLAARVMRMEYSVLPGRVLTFCASMETYSDHVDVICAKEDAAECLDAVVTFLSRDYRAWDVTHLSHVAEDARLVEFVRARPLPFGVFVRSVSNAAYIPLEAGFSGFREALSRSARHNLRRAQTRLHREVGVTYGGPDSTSAVPSSVREVFDLHNRRAAKKGTETNFRGDALMRFHAEVASLSHEAGRLRLRFLRQNGAPIAVWYCFQLQDRVFTYQQGFDPEWESLSAARVLLYDLIEEACREGITEIDMLRGGWEFKAHWTSHRRDLMRVNLYNRTPAGLLLQVTDRGRSALAPIAKRLFRRGR
jgi:CelD/BcsL family acetyltransferase involved in cellulose biosynthesis